MSFTTSLPESGKQLPPSAQNLMMAAHGWKYVEFAHRAEPVEETVQPVASMDRGRSETNRGRMDTPARQTTHACQPAATPRQVLCFDWSETASRYRTTQPEIA